MKIKVRTEDFIVEELSGINLLSEPSNYRVYQLDKQGFEMFRLTDELSAKLHLPKKDISYSGIKDKHGKTSQYIAIRNQLNLPSVLEGKGYKITQAGYCENSLSSKDITGNRFTLTLRDIQPIEENKIIDNCELIQRFGFPNYFDDQRFGSARHGMGFMGKELFLGNKEKALKLFFTPSGEDRNIERVFKESVIENWGNWKKVLETDGPSEMVKVIKFLAQDYKDRAFSQALSYIDHNLLILIASSYRSFLFNRILSDFIKKTSFINKFEAIETSSAAGNIYFYQTLPEDVLKIWKEKFLPEPAYDTIIKETEIQSILDAILIEEGIKLEEMKIRQIYGVTLHGKERKMLVYPENLIRGELEMDELYTKNKKLKLEFSLPKGSYATMVVKRLAL